MPQFDGSPYTQLTTPARGDVQGVIKDISEALPENQTKYAELQDLLKFGAWASKILAVTASGSVTLADTDPAFVEIDPNGSNRDVNFPAKGNDNHGYFVHHVGSANTLTLKRSGGATITTLAVGEIKYIKPSTTHDFSAQTGGSSGSYGSLFPHDGVMLNGKISVSVASNNLMVAIKTLAGTDPSSSDPVYVRINGTVRSITAALSRTLAAATNWMNLGSAELATKEVDLFPYLVWDSNSSAVGLTFARIPFAALVSDFNSTSTNEKYCAGYSDFTSTDDVVNIGRFAATLSAGAGYTWTVPTFTNVNLKQSPTFESRWLNYAPQFSGLSLMTVTGVTLSHAKYKARTGNDVELDVVASAFTIGGTPSSLIYMTLPFSSSQSDFPLISGGVPITDAGGGDMGYLRCDSTVTRAAWAKRTGGNYSSGAGTFLAGHGEYSI